MSKREKLLRSLSSAQFALWELHLYLDTHPADLTAISLHSQYKTKYDTLLTEYEEEYGPLSAKIGEGVEWLKDPWPWEKESDC